MMVMIMVIAVVIMLTSLSNSLSAVVMSFMSVPTSPSNVYVKNVRPHREFIDDQLDRCLLNFFIITRSTRSYPSYFASRGGEALTQCCLVLFREYELSLMKHYSSESRLNSRNDTSHRRSCVGLLHMCNTNLANAEKPRCPDHRYRQGQCQRQQAFT